jgi:hypothetical protein
MPLEGASAPPSDLRRDLQRTWPSIVERVQKKENVQKTIERLQLFLNGGDDGPDSTDSTVYATDAGAWTLWRVNPETGHSETVEQRLPARCQFGPRTCVFRRRQVSRSCDVELRAQRNPLPVPSTLEPRWLRLQTSLTLKIGCGRIPGHVVG